MALEGLCHPSVEKHALTRLTFCIPGPGAPPPDWRFPDELRSSDLKR